MGAVLGTIRKPTGVGGLAGRAAGEAAVPLVNESHRLAALRGGDGATAVHRSAAGHMCLA